jgi:hypothetical protein
MQIVHSSQAPANESRQHGERNAGGAFARRKFPDVAVHKLSVLLRCERNSQSLT